MYANSLHGNRDIPGAINCKSAIGPVEEGQWPQSRHVRDWEVGRGNSIDEGANKGIQPQDIGQLPAEFVEKRLPAEGNTGPDDRDQHSGVGISVERIGQGTRGSKEGQRITIYQFVASH